MANRAERDDDPLFVTDGAPVKFCFHQSVMQGRDRITRDIESHGGQIVADERHANVLLVDEEQDISFLRRRYYSSTELYRLSLYVEPRGFVQSCMRVGAYRHAAPVAQGMPGRAPGSGRARVPFTEEDRDHLAYYLATRCSKKDGRLGMNAYKDLERLGQTQDPSWTWARLHTVHSWREHYKMNQGVMDGRINRYLQQLKDNGHHFGHDPRRHDFRNLVREEEEEEEGEEEDERDRGIGRPHRERRKQIRPAAAERRRNQRARDYLARHERDLVIIDDEESDEVEEIVIRESQRGKRHRVPPDVHPQPDSREMQAKRMRVAKASANEGRASDVEAGRAGAGSAQGDDSDQPESQELKGHDLYGDRAHQDETRFDIDDQEVHFPGLVGPRAHPGADQDAPPLSTQATLIASPRSPRKEPSPTAISSPTKVVEAAPQSAALPSSQPTLVATQERVVQRGRVRGASAQPGPSMPREARARGARAVDAPYLNIHARSRSAEPEAEYPQQRDAQRGRGKGKAKQRAHSPVGEEIHEEEGQREVEENGGSISVTVRETFEDEMAVEGLLDASGNGGVDEGTESEEEQVERGEISDGDDDTHGMPELPGYQIVKVEEEPSDSDDAETHASLVRDAVRGGSADEGDVSSESDHDQKENEGDDDSDDDDADRIERMVSGGLYVAPAPTSIQPRVTRSMVATQARAEVETRHISPRRTRSGTQVRAASRPTVFPSPGTKARAVVDRFQEEGKRMPYAPPLGTRAAKAVKARGRRG